MQVTYHKSLRVTILLLVLVVQYVSCANDKKPEFRNKLVTELKTQGLELYESLIQELKALCETLLKVAKPTAEQTRKLQADITYFEKLSRDKHQMSPAELLASFETAIVDKAMKYLGEAWSSSNVYEADQLVVVTPIIESIKRGENEVTKFANSFYNTWTQLYATLGKEELSKYAEIENINELMQGIVRNENIRSVFQDVIKAIIKFFGYEEEDFFGKTKNENV